MGKADRLGAIGLGFPQWEGVELKKESLFPVVVWQHITCKGVH